MDEQSGESEEEEVIDEGIGDILVTKYELCKAHYMMKKSTNTQYMTKI